MGDALCIRRLLPYVSTIECVWLDYAMGVIPNIFVALFKYSEFVVPPIA
jgi:hypothetical protein